MTEIRLTYSTDDGPQEITLDGGRTSFGRGEEVDHRIADDGLSRLHATVYRESDNVWIVDENSTNGTFVNGSAVQSAGTPLRNGDIIRIGNHTNMRVAISQTAVAASPSTKATTPAVAAATAPVTSGSPLPVLPIVLIAGALFVIGITTVVIGFTVFGSSNPQIVQRETYPEDDPPVKDPKESPTPKSSPSPGSTGLPNAPSRGGSGSTSDTHPRS